MLLCIGYFQPITHAELSKVFGTISRLRKLGFVAAGPRSPQPGAPIHGACPSSLGGRTAGRVSAPHLYGLSRCSVLKLATSFLTEIWTCRPIVLIMKKIRGRT